LSNAEINSKYLLFDALKSKDKRVRL
jgi:hypothetical protein